MCIYLICQMWKVVDYYCLVVPRVREVCAGYLAVRAVLTERSGGFHTAYAFQVLQHALVGPAFVK